MPLASAAATAARLKRRQVSRTPQEAVQSMHSLPMYGTLSRPVAEPPPAFSQVLEEAVGKLQEDIRREQYETRRSVRRVLEEMVELRRDLREQKSVSPDVSGSLKEGPEALSRFPSPMATQNSVGDTSVPWSPKPAGMQGGMPRGGRLSSFGNSSDSSIMRVGSAPKQQKTVEFTAEFTESRSMGSLPTSGRRMGSQPSLQSFGTFEDFLRKTTTTGSGVQYPSDNTPDDMSLLRKSATVEHPTHSLQRMSNSYSEITAHAMLPDGWPHGIVMRKEALDGFGYSTSLGEGSAHMIMAALEEDKYEAEAAPTSERGSSWPSMRSLVINPHSTLCAAFDAVSLLLLFYELTVIPVVLAWSFSRVGGISVLMWVTKVFWTVDLVFNFFRGYDIGGTLQMDPYKVCMNYLKSFFTLDLCIVLTDWLTEIMFLLDQSDEIANGEAKMLRFAKVGRTLRILAMARVVKYMRVLDELVNRHMAVKYFMCLKVASVVVALLWFNHLLACAWYAIGAHGPTDTGRRWAESSQILQEDFGYTYWTSMHWAISQSVLGAIEIPSVNSVERIYTILCMIAGLVIGSTLVSSLSASMVEFQMSYNERGQMLRTLRKFLADHQISTAVAFRVQKMVRERLCHKMRLTDREVPALGLVTDSLLATLRTEIFSTKVQSLPIFETWSLVDSGLIRALCTEGVEYVYMRPHDHLFTPCFEMNYAYMFDKGAATYSQTALLRSVRLAPSSESFLDRGCWLCEMALWTHWLTVGTCVSAENSEFVRVAASVVWTLSLVPGPARELSSEYRKIVHRRIASSVPPWSAYPTDLCVDYASFPDVAAAWSVDIKAMLAQRFLTCEATSRPWRWSSARTLMKLTEELDKHKSTVLLLRPEGHGIERVTLQVAASIESSEGKRLVHIGKWWKDAEDDCPQLQASCQLPTLKQDAAESPGDAIQRLLDTRLVGIGSDIHVTSASRETTVKDPYSRTRMKTISTIFEFEVVGTFDNTWTCTADEDVHLPSSRSVLAPGHQPSCSSSSSVEAREVFIIPQAANPNQRNVYTWMWLDEFQSLESAGNSMVSTVVMPLLAQLPFAEFEKHEEARRQALVTQEDSETECVDEV